MLTRNLFGVPYTGWQNPLAELNHMVRRMDQLTNAFFGRDVRRLAMPKVFPALNITEDTDKYYIRAELPGVKPDDLKLEVTGKSLSIAGERKIQPENDNARYHRREREAGKFSRAVVLPGDVDADNLDAKLVNGILTITIAKSTATQPKQITIK